MFTGDGGFLLEKLLDVSCYFCCLSVIMHFVFFQDLILEINKLRYRLTDLESEKLQYEKKLKSTKVSCHREFYTLCVYMKNHSVLPCHYFLAVKDFQALSSLIPLLLLK